VPRVKISGKTILVTGASGFIGHHLCKKLAASGCEIHGISRSRRQDTKNGIKWWHSDLMEPVALQQIIKSIKPDIVYHLSGCSSGSREIKLVLPTFQSNLISTVNLLVALDKVGCERILLTGSMEEPRSNEIDFSSISPYAAAKWASSIYGKMFHALYSLPVVMLQVFMTYGPQQTNLAKLVPYVINSLLKNEIPKLTSGSRKIDWVYVEDVIDGLIATAQAKDVVGETVEIGSGELLTISDIVEKLVDQINPTIKPEFRAIEDRPFEGVRKADVKRTYELIGWRAKIPVNEGLQRTAKWYEEQLIAG
jgi:UDP-glucose 4-epimerase